MNRRPRFEHERGVFHVMVQGINKEYIFEKRIDKEDYLSLLNIYKNKFEIMLLAYCIMDNHAHMLIYTDEVYEVSKYMGIVNSKFARNYNTANERVGYVFRDRFNSQYIDTNEYLLKCLNYIHMNPVKAKMVEKPEEYKYSSYNDYINKKGIADDKVIDKIFGGEGDYLLKFTSIPNEEIEIMDIDREKKNLEIAAKNYLKLIDVNIDDVKNKEEMLRDFCRYLIIDKKYKQNQIAKFLGLHRSKIYRIMKEREQE